MDVEGAPAFEEIDDHADLIAWSAAYSRRVRREWGVDVRLDLVEWDVSTRARRRAAAVKRPVLDDAVVGEPYDWDALPDADGRPLACTVSLTWAAFADFDREEWAATLRHELVHVEQYQAFGTTGHGPAFEERAADLETPVHCRVFADPKWAFRCTDCGQVVARRYRDCEFARTYDRYHSDCCEASLERETVEASGD